MKRILLTCAAALCAFSAFAGTTYRFESRSSGPVSVTLSATVQADGPNVRMDVDSGDGMMFRNGSIVLTRDAGHTLTVLDPATKTYYTLALDDLLGGGKSALGALGSMMKIDFANPSVDVTDGGDGGTVEGFPTRKTLVRSAYDMNIDAMGQKLSMHVDMTSENWLTDRIGSDVINAFQMRGFKTGVESLDKMVDAHRDAMRGFPLKQIVTVKIKQPTGAEISTSTTTTVKDVQQAPIAAARFEMPSGYTKGDSPVEKMMKSIKQMQ